MCCSKPKIEVTISMTDGPEGRRFTVSAKGPAAGASWEDKIILSFGDAMLYVLECMCAALHKQPMPALEQRSLEDL